MANVITDPNFILILHMRQQLMALYLETKGMKHSQGSICQFIRRQYDIHCRKKVDVYRIFHSIILEKEKEAGLEPRPLNSMEKSILET